MITCIGSVFVRSDLSMNFRYTDLDKFINYIGFETGVWCVYPNYWSTGYLLDGEQGEAKFKCMQNQFFRDTYLNGSQTAETPHHYDPRCRAWYAEAYKKNTSAFSDIYTYVEGALGITNCVPLWGSDRESFYGSYCLD